MNKIDKKLSSIIKNGLNPRIIVVSIPFWMEIQEDKGIHSNKYGDTFYKDLRLFVNPKLKEGFYFK